MQATRKRYTKEFKLGAVRQLAAGTRLVDVARVLGVNATVVRRMRRPYVPSPQREPSAAAGEPDAG